MQSSNVYYGVVEERTSDPLKLGRCRVRIVGVHTEDNTVLPTKDLPWAYPMMPVNSASMCGIGYSPTGIVEGTWCILIFRDQAQQQPIIIGTIGGIPEAETDTAAAAPSSSTLKSQDGSVITDSTGNPVASGPLPEPKPDVVPEPVKPDKKPAALKASGMKTSQAGIDIIIFEEGISSLVRGANKAVKKYPSDGTLLYPYLDTRKIWTVGVGSTYMLDGSRVGPDSVVTVAVAKEMLMMHLAKEVEGPLNRNIKAPITQEMFDSMASMAYNMGAGGWLRSAAFSSLNAGKYEEAAALIPSTRTGGGNGPRRIREAAHFRSGGIPNKENGIDPLPVDPATQKPAPRDATENTAVRSVNPTPVNSPTTTAEKRNASNTGGFKDPNKKYPIESWLNEPDTHRLARNEDIDKTVVYTKEAARARGVNTAGAKWTQPPIPYNAKYPYNKTFVTESGHIDEWDDTPGNERLHRYHKSGTYEEIDVNGTMVTRIVGDDYEILERHGNVLIKGNCNVTIRGNSNIRVDNNANIEVGGNMHSSVHGNWDIGVAGDIKVKAGGIIALDGSKVYLNSGRANTAPRGDGASEMPQFSQLSTPSRHAEIQASYDSPEDGDNTEFLDAQIAAGALTAEDVTAKTETVEEVTPVKPEPPTKPLPAGCEGLTLPFSSSTRLSANYTMGDFIKESSPARGIPSSPQAGFSVLDLGCNMKFIATNVAEVVKARYPNMKINSCFRSAAANSGIPGASTKSKHMSGLALDMGFIGFNNKQKYEAAIEIQKLLPDYDQIILEYSGASCWIHVGLNKSGNRRQILTMDVGRGGKTIRDKFVLLG
jgi:GH24 family phage-related lysozyme (muramidase)